LIKNETKKVSLNNGRPEEIKTESETPQSNEPIGNEKRGRNPSHRRLFTLVGIILAVLILSGSGWGYMSWKTNRDNNKTLMATLDAQFQQQYGTTNVTIKQFMRAKITYVAVWTDGKNTNVSWNVGGLWVTVYSQSIASTTPPPTTTPATTP